jgi:hypothetical protein
MIDLVVDGLHARLKLLLNRVTHHGRKGCAEPEALASASGQSSQRQTSQVARFARRWHPGKCRSRGEPRIREVHSAADQSRLPICLTKKPTAQLGGSQTSQIRSNSESLRAIDEQPGYERPNFCELIRASQVSD